MTLAVAGCGTGDQEESTPFTVPRSPAAVSSPTASEIASPESPDPHAAVATGGPQRLLAAIVPKGDLAWFFKASGPAEAVAGQVESFQKLARSITFNADGSPRWSLPEGWQQKPGSGMRFATLSATTSAGSLDVSVTPLRIPDEIRAFVLVNVNRWRDQLGLAPTTAASLFAPDARPAELVEQALTGGETLMLVDLTGEPKADTPTTPMLPAAHPPLGGRSMAATGEGSGPAGMDVSKLSYATPPGWTPGTVGGMRAAAFQIKDGDRVAELTAIPLALGSGDLLSNVNRWREQVKLPPLDQKTLDASIRPIDVGGAKGQRVELVGPADARPREAILGAICTQGDQVWFFKLKGDADLVLREATRFDAFLGSVRFPGRSDAAAPVPSGRDSTSAPESSPRN